MIVNYGFLDAIAAVALIQESVLVGIVATVRRICPKKPSAESGVAPKALYFCTIRAIRANYAVLGRSPNLTPFRVPLLPKLLRLIGRNFGFVELVRVERRPKMLARSPLEQFSQAFIVATYCL